MANSKKNQLIEKKEKNKQRKYILGLHTLSMECVQFLQFMKYILHRMLPQEATPCPWRKSFCLAWNSIYSKVTL